MQTAADGPIWTALSLGAPSSGGPPVVAVVGAGGKTTLVYRLGLEAAAHGRNSIITGTTRFTRLEPMPPLLQAPTDGIAGHVEEAFRSDPDCHCVVLAGNVEQPAGRLEPLGREVIDELAGTPGIGLIAFQADGSKMRPFKAPEAHEPVIPDSTTHVVAVVGVDALDAPLDETRVHRPERVRAILGHDRRSIHQGETCDAEMIATVLAHVEGGRKDVGDRAFSVVVNKADIDLDSAVRLARAIRQAGVERVVIAALHEEGNPIRDVLHSDDVTHEA